MTNFDYTSDEGRRLAADSLSHVQICVHDMREAGFKDYEIAAALGVHMLDRIERALPDKGQRVIWLRKMLSGHL